MVDIFDGARRKLSEKALPWLLKRKFGADGINAAATRNVALFPKSNLAFNRVKKNGNSTTVSLLHAMEDGNFRTPKHAKRHSSLVRRADLPQLLNASNFFHFVIIRNPYSRTLSAFLNKFSKPAYIERFGNFALTAEGFEKFLTWLDQSGLEADAHWDLQKKLILGPLPCFDAVLGFEEFPECLENLLADRGLQMPNTAEEILASVQRDTRTGASLRLEQFYSRKSADIVRTLYQQDFDFLGYSSNFRDAGISSEAVNQVPAAAVRKAAS